MNPYLQGLLTSAFGDQVNKRTGLGDRAYGLLSDLASAILPEAAAADASSIPVARNYPTTTSGQPAQTYPYPNYMPDPQGNLVDVSPPSWVPQSFLDEAEQQKQELLAQQGLLPEQPVIEPNKPTEQPTPVGAPVQEGPTDMAVGMYPEGKPEEEGGFFDALSSVYDSTFGDEEWRLRKLIALQGMTFNPNPQVAASLNDQLKAVRARRGTPETVQALINMGQKDLAAMVQAGQLTPKEALTIAYKSPKTTYTLKKGSEISPNLPPEEMYKVSSQGDVEPVYDKPLSETAGTETIKGFVPVLKDTYDAAKSGMKEIQNIDKNLDMLNSDKAFTGTFSKYKRDLAAFMASMGSQLAEQGATQTQILEAALQAGVFKAFVEAGLTSKQMDTPAEREMIMKAFSGDISMTKNALIELQMRRREKAVGNVKTYDQFKSEGAYDIANKYAKIPYLDTSGVKYSYQYTPTIGGKQKKPKGFKRDASGRLVPIY